MLISPLSGVDSSQDYYRFRKALGDNLALKLCVSQVHRIGVDRTLRYGFHFVVEDRVRYGLDALGEESTYSISPYHDDCFLHTMCLLITDAYNAGTVFVAFERNQPSHHVHRVAPPGNNVADLL